MKEYTLISIAIFFISFILTVLLERVSIPKLAKIAQQPIYSDGPSWHSSKSGTPTMGGAAFIVAILPSLGIAIAYLLIHDMRGSVLSLLISLSFALYNALIGAVDDLTKLRRRQNAGLTPIQKLAFQFIGACTFLVLRATLLGDGTTIHLPIGEIDLGILYYPLSVIMLLGIVNCANLTDGVDGLASSVAFSSSGILLILSVSSAYDVAFTSLCTMGALLAFLIFNLHPAKIFMGDTGSLFLGAILVSSAFSLKNPILMIPIGVVYVIEGISVILQVLCYKMTGKRIFKMAPLHHHLEKCGVSENGICIIAIAATLIASAALLILV